MKDQVEQKEKSFTEQQIASQECTGKCLAEVLATQAEKSQHGGGKIDQTKEINAEAKEIASIVKSSANVLDAADDPKLGKLLTSARDSQQLDQLLKATNSIMENRKGQVGYTLQTNEFFGILLKKEDRADSTITSDDPRFAGPMSEKQLDAAAAKIAKVVAETGTLGDENSKHEINQTFGRALKNHQEDKLLEKINGDNLGDADITGTHQYIVKQALGVNWHGNHMSKFTVINDEVAIVPVTLDQKKN